MLKSCLIITLSFGLDVIGDGRGRRVSAIMEVMEGFWSAWWRISEPMKPVLPVSMNFIFG